MGGGHHLDLHRPGETLLHRLPAHCKIVAAFGYVLTVVLTPIDAGWAFGAHLLVVGGLCALARLTPGYVARRLTVEIPFVAFAVALPFVASGERVEVLGLALSRTGLEQAFGLLARATLGLLTVIVLAATTPVRELLVGLERLRLPPVIVAVASFMIRYAGVIVDQLQRMAVARRSRCHEPRSLLGSRAIAASLGTLFIRSYERGERVHLAMLARGYTGVMPVLSPGGAAHRAGGAQPRRSWFSRAAGEPPPEAAAWTAVGGLLALGAVIAAAGHGLGAGWPA